MCSAHIFKQTGLSKLRGISTCSKKLVGGRRSGVTLPPHSCVVRWPLQMCEHYLRESEQDVAWQHVRQHGKYHINVRLRLVEVATRSLEYQMPDMLETGILWTESSV
jgi:hypothetical protein